VSLSTAIPWQAKIAAKLVLSRLPLDYRAWQRLRLFRHGRMDQPSYALDVFENHFRRAKSAGLPDRFVALEMGPGDSLFCGMIAAALGATKTWLVDVAADARNDLEPYRRMAERLRAKGLAVSNKIESAETLSDVLTSCNAEYCTQGLQSLKTVPAESVDFIWSQAVLEHVRRHEFEETIRETFRALRPGGIASHRVDLRDHLGGRLNNLRFSQRFWEHPVVSRSGFYTNRIQYSAMLKIFERAGFRIQNSLPRRWPELPTPKGRLNSQFRELDDQELMVSGFDVVLVKD
jgi:SAM-dependent methyltransferase